MSTLRKPSRSRKPLRPVRVTARLTGASDRAALPDELAQGCAILSIVSGDETDPDVRLYWVKILFDRDRKPYAVELLRFNTNERYLITLADERCDCPDAVYAANRPGGCKHLVALRQTLPAVASEKAGAA